MCNVLVRVCLERACVRLRGLVLGKMHPSVRACVVFVRACVCSIGISRRRAFVFIGV
jgi:hypothetical protein